jgi:sugar/nucleoside kinase (ribokinase family)
MSGHMAHGRGALVVLGDVLTDVTVRLPHAPRPATDTPARITWQPGGAGANVARWLAFLGARDVHLVGRVGADDRGRGLRTTLRHAGVRPWIAEDEVRATGSVVVLVEGDGGRTMLTDRGAALALAADDLPEGLLTEGAHLHLSGYALTDPGTRTAAVAALERARGAGTTISLDPSSAGPLVDMGSRRFTELAGPVDLWLPNLDEAVLLTGARTPDDAARRLADGGIAVVSCGASGLVWSDGERAVAVPAAPGQVLDTTGAGDAVTAAVLLAWRAGAAVEDLLTSAARAAAVAVGRVGAGPPDRSTEAR